MVQIKEKTQKHVHCTTQKKKKILKSKWCQLFKKYFMKTSKTVVNTTYMDVYGNT